MNNLKNNSAYITGMGTINCTGRSPEELWQGLQRGESFIKQGMGRISEELLLSIQSELSQSPFQAWVSHLYEDVAANKFYICTLYAIHQALEQAGWDGLSSEDCLILATTSGQIPIWESSLADYSLNQSTLEDLMPTFRQEALGFLMNQLQNYLGTKCQSYVISSACNASTQAIFLANLLLRENRFKRCLVGGTELLCDLIVQGFKSLQILSEEPATPFTYNRRGINLSEGSAFLCIEKTPQAKPIAALAGGSFVSESFHMTSPDPKGKGYHLAMQLALKDSGLHFKDISWIHAHGTGSQKNDLSEANAIESLFPEFIPWVSSTKSIHGHMLGASGVLESIICLLSIREKQIPATAGFESKDPAIGIPIVNEFKSGPIENVLKNTAGFGGNNSSLVFSRV